MRTTNSSETAAVLAEWRTKILNGFLVVAAAAMVPVVGMTAIAAIKKPEQWPAVALFTFLLLLLAVLAVWRGLDLRVRAVGLLLLGYVAGIVSLARGGLAGSGRDYLVVLPIVAVILVGVRASIRLTVFSALVLAVFAVLADRGFLAPWLVDTQNPLRLVDWVTEGGTTLALLAITMVLLVLFHRFQVQVIDKERHAWAEVLEARALLEEQNRTLEDRIAQRTAELARATSEAEHEKLYSEALIENSPVAIVATGPAADVVTWNPAAEKLFGYTAAEAIGRNLDELVANDPALHAEAVSYSQQVVAEASIRSITQRTRRDGTLVDVEVWGVPVIIGEGGTRTLGLYHDMTEIKRAQDALEDSHRRLADIINFMPDAVLVIDQEGKVITWNRAIEEMTGAKAEEMLGKGDHEYALPFYGERRPILIDMVRVPQKELEEKYTQIRMEGPILVGETYVPQLRGVGHYLLGTASALHDSKGQVVGAIEVIRDFTERKHMEEALHQAKEAAESATQAKSAFLATMSHEIRTPMNAVIGMTGLLLDTPLTPEQREFAETIRSSGDALLAIINDILDFSKIEAGRMELESQPFDLRECVESAMDLLAARATEKGLNLGCVVERDVPAAIIGDVTRLRQVVVNLLSNAVKFTEQGEVVVTVERRGEVASPLQELHFVVRDTGIGVPPELMGRLFQSFSQVDASTTRRFGGTGLGLAISRRLTELMGGKMSVESPAPSSLQVGGPGSAFHFTIRAEVATAPVARAYPQGVQSRLEGKRALIVDDNPTNRRILSLQTQAWGMLPHQTGSPAEALEWLRRGDPFDVAFLDLQMPDMDGVALAAEIRRLREASALPLVILSSLGKREAQAEEGDWAAFLLKPIKASQLYNVLVGIFGIEAGEAPTPQAETKPAFEADMGQRHPLRILLAEDNLVNQKLAVRLLERMGYRADMAANGLEVLQSLRRQPYDVILMDVQMPEMDGLEASRAIWAEWPAESRPRIVAMTANVMPEDRQECLAAGMDDFIAKPIRVDELVAALSRSRLLGRNRPEAGSASPAPAA